jgi:uncharacterized protein YbgA (DUF1722 family)
LEEDRASREELYSFHNSYKLYILMADTEKQSEEMLGR